MPNATLPITNATLPMANATLPITNATCPIDSNSMAALPAFGVSQSIIAFDTVGVRKLVCVGASIAMLVCVCVSMCAVFSPEISVRRVHWVSLVDLKE